MAIRYKLVQRKDFTEGAGKDDKLFYASIVSNGTVTLNELCESIAEETAQTSADVKSIFDRLPRILRRHLNEGRNVQLGELGSIRMTLGSKGAPSMEEFNAATMMKRPGIHFTPGKILQDLRDNVTFTRVKKKDEDDNKGEEGSGSDEPIEVS